MSDAALTCTTVHPALLLIEPIFTAHSERAAQLGRLNYCVTQAVAAKEIFLMRHAFRFSVAVLHDGIGYLALRASTQLIRSQWPFARVLILGLAPRGLEDYLYDETAVHAVDEEALCVALHNLVEDQGKLNGNGGAMLPDRGRLTPRQIASWIVQESDPTKVARPLGGAAAAQSWPASTKRFDGFRR